MKVLFLDIDGVLNCAKSENFRVLNRAMVARLNTVVAQTGCWVVISSAWGWYDRTERALNLAGFLYTTRVRGATPRVVGNTIRGVEIGAWLMAHPGVTAFAIVDDGDDMGDLLPALVKTDWESGLQGRHVDELIQRLGRKER